MYKYKYIIYPSLCIYPFMHTSISTFIPTPTPTSVYLVRNEVYLCRGLWTSAFWVPHASSPPLFVAVRGKQVFQEGLMGAAEDKVLDPGEDDTSLLNGGPCAQTLTLPGVCSQP